MDHTSQLVGKSAIVTGGSRGIGLATAIALRRAGAGVLICGRSAEALDAAVALIGTATVAAPAGPLVTAVADVRDPEQVERVVSAAVEQLGGVDILINNAGVGRFSRLADLTIEDWRETIDTNLSGVFYCCRAIIPTMTRCGGGWIINISSLAGKHPFAGGTAYCAAKAGLNAFTEALMQEVRRDGIRVSCVLPGSVDTEFAGNQPSDDAAWKLAASDVAQTVVDLLCHPPRSLPSRVELRPAVPRK